MIFLCGSRFLIFLLSLVLSNVEVPKLIDTAVLVRSNHTEPIPDIMFLQVLLCKVLEVPNRCKRDDQ